MRVILTTTLLLSQLILTAQDFSNDSIRVMVKSKSCVSQSEYKPPNRYRLKGRLMFMGNDSLEIAADNDDHLVTIPFNCADKIWISQGKGNQILPYTGIGIGVGLIIGGIMMSSADLSELDQNRSDGYLMGGGYGGALGFILGLATIGQERWFRVEIQDLRNAALPVSAMVNPLYPMDVRTSYSIHSYNAL